MNKSFLFDYLIIGAGLYGSTFAHCATSRGYRCLVIDRRNHIGGNLYCRQVEGINVHEYGAHIFHTSDPMVWRFVNDLVPFNRYTNCPIAYAPDGKLYNLPFNMNTFNQLWDVRTPAEAIAKIDTQRKEALAKMYHDGVKEPRNLEEQALSLVGTDIYNLLVKHYTEKQWGRDCRQLPAFIIKRLPLRFTFDNNYFNDTYQGIPKGGYNILVERLLEGSVVKTGIEFSELKDTWHDIADKLVYTGPLDEYFGCKLGRLEWRSVRFETEVIDTPNFQGNAVVNYTDAGTPWTRSIEHKHFETFGDNIYKNPKTVVSREYSAEYKVGMEPYYPINDLRNTELAMAYKQLCSEEKNVIFGGRLAEYKYYDMAPLIAQVLKLWNIS